jgi:hypothetical protein
MAGQGLYYDKPDPTAPSFILADCRRIQKQGLPIYQTEFKGA